MENNEKVISQFPVQVVERVSKKGKTYKMLVIALQGEKKMNLCFLNDEIILSLFKANIKF